MRVLLRDTDMTGFGNLALMKLSAWHRSRGDDVYCNMPGEFDKIYASCVFSWNRDNGHHPAAVVGGTGFGSHAWLLDEVERIMPDYTLYDHDLGYSMGFTSRGCIRKCPWCVVAEKEGGIKPWAEIYEFWNREHTKIRLLDNNLLASPNWRETMEALDRERLEVDFNQGLDIRLVTDEVAWWLKRVRKWSSRLKFGFDAWGYHEHVEAGVRLLGQQGINPGRLHFLVLMGYTLDPEGDYARLELLQRLGCSIFPMIYRDNDGVEHPPAPGPIPVNMHGNRDSLRKLARLKGVV